MWTSGVGFQKAKNARGKDLYEICKKMNIHLSVLGQASEDINIDSVISSNTLKIIVVVLY